MSARKPRFRMPESKLTFFKEHTEDINERSAADFDKSIEAKKALLKKDLERKEEDDIEEKLNNFLSGTSCVVYLPPSAAEIASARKKELEGVQGAILWVEAQLNRTDIAHDKWEEQKFNLIAIINAQLGREDLTKDEREVFELKLETAKNTNRDWDK